MNNLMKLITTALEWSYAEAEKDVCPKHLQAAAELLTLRRDAIHVVDVQSGNDGEKSKKQETTEEAHELPPK